MTASNFNQTCQNFGIHPAVALECEAVVEALENQDNAGVIEALNDNF